MPPRLLSIVVLVAAALVGCGQDGFLGTPPPYPALDAEAFDSTDDATGLRLVAVDDLPVTAVATLALVDAGGPFPNPDDGEPYDDASGSLPSRPPGYYLQYRVAEPGGSDESPWHLVVGEQGEVFWTDDAFDTFRRVQR